MNPKRLEPSDDCQLALYGGRPVRETPWPTYDKGAVFVNPEDEQAAFRALCSHLYFRYDYRPLAETECGKFERKIKDYFGVKHALAVSSGTAALTLSIMGAGIPKDALVACPGFSFTATPSAIVLAGCKPFLVEVDEELNFDLGDLTRRWTPDIKAILVVHMRGFASDMQAVVEFAKQVHVPVIEDVVPSLGVELNHRKLGTFGIAGAFSTQSDKSLNTGEGGFVITNDSTLFARAVVLSGAYEGRYRKHFPDGNLPIASDLYLPLLNFRMDEIRAALASSEMEQLAVRLACFKRNYEYVAHCLADVPEIKIRQPVAPGAYLGESLIFRVNKKQAKLFARALSKEGIDARNLGSEEEDNVRCYWSWRFLFDGQDLATIKRHLPKTTRYLEEAVDVPLSSCLSIEDCDQLVRAVRKVVRGLEMQPSLISDRPHSSVAV